MRYSPRSIESIFKIFYVSVILASFPGCCEKPIPSPEIERSILIYMAANNTLSTYSFENIEMIKSGGFIPANGNLLIYHDAPGTPPRLIRMVRKGDEVIEELIEVYSENEHATDLAVLTRTLIRMQERFPAKEYGLILWSHATGWVPPRTFSSPIPSLSGVFSLPLGYRIEDLPSVKTFGEDRRPGTSEYDEGVDVHQLAAAIAAGAEHLSFILFDCCLMGGVESLYALRNVTDYVVASPAEILGAGFPYHLIIQPLFLPKADLEGVCNAFYNYYNDHPSSSHRSATIALYRTDAVLELAEVTRAVFDAHREEISQFSTTGIQRYANTNVYYDLDEFVLQLSKNQQGEYQLFKSTLDKVVIYKRNTDTFFSLVTSAAYIPIHHYGGISTYIPREVQTFLIEAYKETGWNQAVRLIE